MVHKCHSGTLWYTCAILADGSFFTIGIRCTHGTIICGIHTRLIWTGTLRRRTSDKICTSSIGACHARLTVHIRTAFQLLALAIYTCLIWCTWHISTWEYTSTGLTLKTIAAFISTFATVLHVCIEINRVVRYTLSVLAFFTWITLESAATAVIFVC